MRQILLGLIVCLIWTASAQVAADAAGWFPKVVLAFGEQERAYP